MEISTLRKQIMKHIRRKLDAFKRLEAYRKKSSELLDYEKERTEAMTEKHGDFK